MQQQEEQQHETEDAGPDLSSDSETAAHPRRGDIEKCPVCGSHVDAEAYHCPTCHCFYCYHCRARLQSADIQLQCTNQQCEYYGKLLCDICDPLRVEEDLPTVYAEPEDGYWPGWLILSVLIAAITWYFSDYLTALATAFGVFVVAGIGLQLFGINIFGRKRTVEQQRNRRFHTCIHCQQPVKKMNSNSTR